MFFKIFNNNPVDRVHSYPFYSNNMARTLCHLLHTVFNGTFRLRVLGTFKRTPLAKSRFPINNREKNTRSQSNCVKTESRSITHETARKEHKLNGFSKDYYVKGNCER